jgi:predicted transcriptional regulator
MATEQKKLTKAELIQSLERLPEDATVEDFADHLGYILGIERGLADVEAGRTISHEELLERIRGWQAIAAERSTLKDEVFRSLARLPEDATAEDIEYRVHVVLTLTKRLAEADAWRKVTHEQARERLKHWLN